MKSKVKIFDVVHSIYEIHDPSKLKGVPKIVTAFKGREKDLVSQLRKRYNISDNEFQNIVELNEDSDNDDTEGMTLDEEAGVMAYDDNPLHGQQGQATAMKVVKPDGTVEYEYPSGQKTKRLSALDAGPSLETLEYGMGDDGYSGASGGRKKSRMQSLYDSVRMTISQRSRSFYERSANVRSMFAVWGGLFFLLVSIGILVTVITVARQEQKQREEREAKLNGS